jgi:hypothetical protein
LDQLGALYGKDFCAQVETNRNRAYEFPLESHKQKSTRGKFTSVNPPSEMLKTVLLKSGTPKETPE